VLIGRRVVGDSGRPSPFSRGPNQESSACAQGTVAAGWVLSSVLPREVTLKKDDRPEIVIVASRQDVAALMNPRQAPPIAGAVAGVPGQLCAVRSPLHAEERRVGRALESDGGAQYLAHPCAGLRLRPIHIGSLIKRGDNDVVSERSRARVRRSAARGEECKRHILENTAPKFYAA